MVPDGIHSYIIYINLSRQLDQLLLTSDWLMRDFQSVELIRPQALSQSACLYLHTPHLFVAADVDLEDKVIFSPDWSELWSGGIIVQHLTSCGSDTKTRSIILLVPLWCVSVFRDRLRQVVRRHDEI